MKYHILTIFTMAIILSSCTNPGSSPSESSEGFIIEKGLNVSHWLSQTKIRGAEREAYMQAADFELIAKLGFDHVRIPIDEVHFWDESGNRHEDAFELLHTAINWSFDNNLRVIVDLHVIRSHHFNADDNTLWTDSLEQQKFWGFWEELSAELKQYPVDKLAYELMNEAVADDPEDWNNLIARGIKLVREEEPDRIIVVGSNKWQQVFTFPDLKVPENDTNIILSFHFYSPFLFTHHQAPWSSIGTYDGAVTYPGMTVDTSEYADLDDELLDRIKSENGYFDKASLEEDIMIAKKIADNRGLPLYCGEFGCFPITPLEMRVALYQDLMSIFKKHDIAWSHWNYKNDFPVVDENSLEPIEEIVDALIQN